MPINRRSQEGAEPVEHPPGGSSFQAAKVHQVRSQQSIPSPPETTPISSARELGPRILTLVAHDPGDDPRVGRVMLSCGRVARTDVLAVSPRPQEPVRTYDGRVYVECVAIRDLASVGSRLLGKLGAVLVASAKRISGEGDERPQAGATQALARSLRFAGRMLGALPPMSALGRRARAVSIRPDVILCHDLGALLPGAALKRRFGGALVYDCHDHWSAADRDTPRWGRALVAAIERRALGGADAVVAVTPELGAELERLHALRGVVTAPNDVARPYEETLHTLLAGKPTFGPGEAG
jgi:hypothetical protein